MARLPSFVFPTFLIVFIIVMPLILLYASGYRYFPKRGSLERVGFLLVDGQPKMTTTRLQGKEVGSRLPLYLKNVQPDYYEITLDAAGFHTITTTKQIRSGEGIVLSPLFLLKKNKPLLLTQAQVHSLWRNDNGSYMLVEMTTNGPRGSARQWKLLLTKDTAWKEIPIVPSSPIVHVQFSRGGDGILITTTTDVVLYDMQEGRIYTLPAAYTSVQWDPNRNDYLFGLRGTTLIEIARDSLDTTMIAVNVLAPLVVTQKFFYYPESPGQKTLVAHTKQGEVIPDTRIENFVATQNFYTSFAGGDITVITDRTKPGASTVIVEGGPQTVLSVPSGLPTWTRKGDMVDFYFYTAFDVDYWRQGKESPETFARFGGDIAEVTPLHGTEYVILAQNKSLVALLQKDMQMKPIILLEGLQDVQGIASDATGTHIIIGGTILGIEGIYSLEVRDE